MKFVLRLSAFWASCVIASASSKITNLNPDLKIVRVEAKFSIGPRTVLIPRSSEALSSNTYRNNMYIYININIILHQIRHNIQNYNLPLNETDQDYTVS